MNPIEQLKESLRYMYRYFPKGFLSVHDSSEDSITIYIGDVDIEISKQSGKMLASGHSVEGGQKWRIEKI